MLRRDGETRASEARGRAHPASTRLPPRPSWVLARSTLRHNKGRAAPRHAAHRERCRPSVGIHSLAAGRYGAWLIIDDVAPIWTQRTPWNDCSTLLMWLSDIQWHLAVTWTRPRESIAPGRGGFRGLRRAEGTAAAAVVGGTTSTARSASAARGERAPPGAAADGLLAPVSCRSPHVADFGKPAGARGGPPGTWECLSSVSEAFVLRFRIPPATGAPTGCVSRPAMPSFALYPSAAPERQETLFTPPV